MGTRPAAAPSEELLSIGEVSRMKGVGVKALRHYERIGILKPAWVNPETGYRYYSMGQMPIVDVIIACVDLGIPLSEVRSHTRRDGSLDTEGLFSGGIEAARRRLKEGQLALASLEACDAHATREAAARDVTGCYRRTMDATWLLVVPWESADFDARRYAETITLLTQVARASELAPLAQQGLATTRALGLEPPETPEGWCVILEVSGLPGERRRKPSIGRDACKGKQIACVRLDQTSFSAHRVKDASLTACFKRACAEVTHPLSDCVLVLESWGFGTSTEESCCEVLAEEELD